MGLDLLVSFFQQTRKIMVVKEDFDTYKVVINNNLRLFIDKAPPPPVEITVTGSNHNGHGKYATTGICER
jgi:hypothetical protein